MLLSLPFWTHLASVFFIFKISKYCVHFYTLNFHLVKQEISGYSVLCLHCGVVVVM